MIKILIVDDDIATIEVIRSSINWNEIGIDEIFMAYNVAGAKRILEENAIQIVISDIEMPQESGLDLLRWIRNEKMNCEVLLLTCHERFDYAKNAISYNVAAYLTKPFDIEIMEIALKKIMEKVIQKETIKQTSEYGVWMKKNLRFIKRSFWKQIFEQDWKEKSIIKREIANRNLEIDTEKDYTLVVTKVSNYTEDTKRLEQEVFEFALENFHSEILTGKVVNEDVIKLRAGNVLTFITVCENRESLEKQCYQLIEQFHLYFKFSITCCISNPCQITEFAMTKENIERLFFYHRNSLGKVFNENAMEAQKDSKIQILNLEKLSVMVQNNERNGILRYLKEVFDELSFYKNLNSHTLYLIKQEIIQTVYADLLKKRIQATKLFYDELSIKMENKVLESTIDMIRWVNYILEKKMVYEENLNKSLTMVDKINEYISNHYSENISRNEIAEVFYLTPEYLAKLYKKKTGVSLKEYINEYRIEKAKELLKSNELSISDVAEAVGLNNFSYFSTLFKKSTGMSPKEYKNN